MLAKIAAIALAIPFLMIPSAAARLDIHVSPSDCVAGECSALLAQAVEKCRSSPLPSDGCNIALAAGRYRVKCPAYPQGAMDFAYIQTPGAVDLSRTANLVFGAASAGSPAFLDIDYVSYT